MHLASPLLLALTMAAGAQTPSTPPLAEESRGPLKAWLTVSRAPEPSPDVIFRVTLQNQSQRRQSFLLETPGATFAVRTASGGFFLVPDTCPELSGCAEPALAREAALEPGARMEFAERWNPDGKCVQPGRYTITARLRAYQGARPDDTVDAGSFDPFRLHAELDVRRDAATGRCVANLPAAPAAPRPECTSDAECRGGLTCESGRCMEGRGAACPAGGGKLAPVFFAVGQAVLTAEARSILGRDASCIRQRGFRKIVVEGHCDERWTAQANLELGRRRAEAVRALLVDLGVEAGDVEVVSRGEEDPVCSERTEDCWQRNRRADVLAELRE